MGLLDSLKNSLSSAKKNIVVPSFVGIKEVLSNIPENIEKAGSKVLESMERPPEPVKTGANSMKFEIGAGMDNETKVLPGPRISTLKAIDRGDVVSIAKPGEELKESKAGRAKEAFKAKLATHIEKAPPKITAGEQFKESVKSGSFLPFVKGMVDFDRAVKVGNAAKRFKNDSYNLKDAFDVAQQEEDIKILKDYINKSNKDKTFGAQVTEVLVSLPGFAAELYLTRGLANVVKKGTEKAVVSGVIKASGKNYLDYLATTAGKELLKKKLSQNLAIRGIGTLVGATVQTPLAGATRIAAGTAEKMIPEISQTDTGELKVGEGQKFGPALAKAFFEQWVETVSERSGKLFDVAPGVVKKAFNALTGAKKTAVVKAAVINAITKNNPGIKSSKLASVLDKVGWNGVLEEMGEERIGEAMNGVLYELGLSDQEYKAPSLNQLGVELVAFAIPGMAISALDKVMPKTKAGTTIADDGKTLPDEFFREKEVADDLMTQAPRTIEGKTYENFDEFVKAQGTLVYSGGSEITKAWSNEKMGGFGTIFRGRNELGGGIYVTDSPEYAGTFGSQLTESSLKPNLKLLDIRESSKEIGTSALNKIKKGFDSYDWYLKNGGEELLPTDYPNEILDKIQNVYGGNSTNILKKAGFDGIIGDESRIGGQGGTVWNIFDANSLKTKSELIEKWNKAQGK